jgi:hypothetical protein
MEAVQRMFPEEVPPWQVEELAWIEGVVHLVEEEEVRLVEEVVHLESVELLPELMVVSELPWVEVVVHQVGS